MKEISCPGCGRFEHYFTIPEQPGTYRLSCQSDSQQKIMISLSEDGQITGQVEKDSK